MNAVQLAEKALKEAKEKEKLDERKKEIDNLKNAYEGKCFATHTFDRNHNAAYMSAVYYELFYIDDKGEIWVTQHDLHCNHFNSHYKKSMKDIQYGKGVSKRQLTGQNDYNASYNLEGFSNFKHEITLDKFKELWAAGEEASQIIKDAFRGKLPTIKDEWITQGDYSQEAVIETAFVDMKIEMIDFKDYPEVYSVLEYHTIPMFYKNRWIPKIYVKQVIQWHINQLIKKSHSSFVTHRVYENDQREIKILSDFISLF